MPGTSQLLDGQQRVNALISLFSEHGKFGHFLLDMGANRTADVLGARLRDREASIRYIHWRARMASEPEPLDTRSRCVDLTRWRAWASEQDEVQLRATVKNDALLALHSLDPDFEPQQAKDAFYELEVAGVCKEAGFTVSLREPDPDAKRLQKRSGSSEYKGALV
jgi:hypothetical protein